MLNRGRRRRSMETTPKTGRKEAAKIPPCAVLATNQISIAAHDRVSRTRSKEAFVREILTPGRNFLSEAQSSVRSELGTSLSQLCPFWAGFLRVSLSLMHCCGRLGPRSQTTNFKVRNVGGHFTCRLFVVVGGCPR